jgi:long-chain fatty acid transport protein
MMMSKGSARLLPISVAITINLIAVDAANASGFRIPEQSAAQVANANAGSSALADDPTTVITNPAGMAFLDESGVSIYAATISSSVNFDDSNSSSPSGPYIGTPTVREKSIGAIPSITAFTKVSEKMKIGLAVFAPYGLKKNYPADWIGRYQAVKNEALSLELNASLAYRLSDSLAIAGGMSGQYFDAKLSTTIDYGGLCHVVIGPVPCTAANIAPQRFDGTSTVSVSDWSFGFNFGLMYKASEATTLGISYRSAINHDLKGNISFSDPGLPGPFSAISRGPQTTSSKVQGSAKLPQLISVSLAHRATGKLKLLADATWSDWSVLNTVNLSRDNGAPDLPFAFGFKDHLKMSLGANYQLSERTVLRAGISYAFDLRRAEQTVTFPGDDIISLGAGIGRRLSRRFSIDLAYSYVDNRSAQFSAVGNDGGTLDGVFSVPSHVFALQLNRNF